MISQSLSKPEMASRFTSCAYLNRGWLSKTLGWEILRPPGLTLKALDPTCASWKQLTVAQTLCICQHLHYSILIDRNYPVIHSMECSPWYLHGFLTSFKSTQTTLPLRWVFLNKIPNVFPFRTLHSLSLLSFFFPLQHLPLSNIIFVGFACLPH